MKKTAGHISEILKRILFIGFGIQIILGVIWMCLNFTHVQVFQAEGGFLWRILSAVPTGGAPLLYLLNLAGAVYASYLLTGLRVQSRFVRGFMTASLLTFPPALQCHLAVGPYSLLSSFLIAEGCFLYKARREQKGSTRYFALGCLCWVLATWLAPEYLLLGALPVMICMCSKKIGLYGVLLTLAFGGIAVGGLSLTGDRVLPAKRDLVYAYCSRFAWPELQRITGELGVPEPVRIELKNGLPGADAMKTDFLPKVENLLGSEEAEALMLRMAGYGWYRNAGRIVKEIIADTAAYTVTAPFLIKHLNGNVYSSFTGRNYEKFSYYSPKTAAVCMRYSLRWNCLAAVCGILFGVCSLCTGDFKLRRLWNASLVSALVCITVISVTYALTGSGIMDYKLTVAGNLFLLFLCLCPLSGKNEAK